MVGWYYGEKGGVIKAGERGRLAAPILGIMAGEGMAARGAAAMGLMFIASVAIVIFVVTAESSGKDTTTLSTDCSVDPWAPSCHHASMMDMINNIRHRARSNAIAQKKLKMQLLAEEKAVIKKQEEKHADKHKASAKSAAPNLKSTVYNGVDIASKHAIDSSWLSSTSSAQVDEAAWRMNGSRVH
eukprot:765496-Hanusia_phi.AAC.4